VTDSPDYLVIRCVFPTGWYDAADEDTYSAWNEWPPHPFRLFAALIAGAGALERDGRPELADEARTALSLLESSEPPIIDGPAGVGRSLGVAPYVSVSVQAEDAATAFSNRKGGVKLSDTSILSKKLAARRPGTLLPNGSAVSYAFPGAGSLASAVNAAAARVPYLGRPTSPVVMSVTAAKSMPRPSANGERWSPEVSGELRLRCPRPGSLADLDARRAAYIGSGGVEQEPSSAHAALVGYESSRRKAARLAPGGLEAVGVLPAPDERSGTYIPGWLIRAGESAPPEVTLAPVFFSRGNHADGRWLGTLVIGAAVRPEISADLDWYQPWSDMPGMSNHDTYRAVCGSSRRWTTLTPLMVDAADPLGSAKEQVEAASGAVCEAAVVHAEPLVGSIPIPTAWPMSSRPAHATFLFDRYLTGPISADGPRGRGVLWPLDDEGRLL